jgi:hypothetical protein
MGRRILLAGVGPRPTPGAFKVYAPGLRLETFRRVLEAAGHEVFLAEMLFGGDGSLRSTEGEAVCVLPAEESPRREAFESILAQQKPEIIVTSTDVMGNLAARSTFIGPLFCDFFGHPMAERQMQAAVAKSNAGLLGQWREILPILARADCFGVCSSAQKHALLGELGAVGRLGYETANYDFARVLAPANPFEESFHPTNYRVRGAVVSPEARILLFSGGYNTWLDEETLFQAVELAMQRDPLLHYVSTGGAIEGHVNTVFERFHSRVQGSVFKERFHFLGWVSHEDYMSICLEADAGITVDEPTLEGVYGCRNRLFGWIWAGMRALATDLSESTREQLVPHGLVTPLPLKNAEQIAEIINRAVAAGRFDSHEHTRRRELLKAQFSPEHCYKPLLEWVEKPTIAPNSLHSGGLSKNSLVHSMLQLEHLPSILAMLDSLQGSRAFRMFLSTQSVKKQNWDKLLDLLKSVETKQTQDGLNSEEERNTP